MNQMDIDEFIHQKWRVILFECPPPLMISKMRLQREFHCHWRKAIAWLCTQPNYIVMKTTAHMLSCCCWYKRYLAFKIDIGMKQSHAHT